MNFEMELMRTRKQIGTVIARYSQSGGPIRSPVPGLRVGRITSPIRQSTVLYEPSLCMCMRGSKRVVIGDEQFIQNEDNFALFTAGIPAIVSIDDAAPSQPYIALSVALDLDVARQVMAEIDARAIASHRSETCLVLGNVTQELLDAVLRLVKLIERPSEIAFMVGLLQREILFRLLTGPTGQTLRQTVYAGSSGHRIAKAIEWIQLHYTDKLEISRLATLSGMGLSTFHRHFYKMTMMSPLQYQKSLRLHEARRLMLVDCLDASSAAFHVGYESVTQFTREYRRLFGGPPLRDVKGLRDLGQRSIP